jgi:hypothetical protein
MPNNRSLFEMIASGLIWAPFIACHAAIFYLSARENAYSYTEQIPSSRIFHKPAVASQ